MSGSGATLGSAGFGLFVDMQQYEAGFQRAEGIARSATTNIARTLGQGLSIGLGIGAITSGVVAIRRVFDAASASVIGFNSDIADATVTFGKFLGTTDAATQKLAYLFDFARKTPFGFQGVQQASLVMQALGSFTLNTAEYMQLFGDAAAAVQSAAGGMNKSLELTAELSGRLFAVLETGSGNIGRLILRMEQLGLIAPEVASRMNVLISEGANPDEIYKVYTDGLKRFEGTLDQLEQNYSTQLASIQDYILQKTAQVGKPVYDAVTEVLDQANKLFGSGQAATFFAESTEDVDAFVQRIRAFVQDPMVQEAFGEWADAAKKAFQTSAEFARGFFNAVSAIAAPIALVVGGLNELSGNNLLSWGILAAGALKYRDVLQNIIGVATGQINIFQRLNDGSGKFLVTKERMAAAEERNAKLADATAQALIRQENAQDRVSASERRSQASQRRVGSLEGRLSELGTLRNNALDRGRDQGFAVLAAEDRKSLADAQVDVRGGKDRLIRQSQLQSGLVRELNTANQQLTAATDKQSEAEARAAAAVAEHVAALELLRDATVEQSAAEAAAAATAAKVAVARNDLDIANAAAAEKRAAMAAAERRVAASQQRDVQLDALNSAGYYKTDTEIKGFNRSKQRNKIESALFKEQFDETVRQLKDATDFVTLAREEYDAAVLGDTAAKSRVSAAKGNVAYLEDNVSDLAKRQATAQAALAEQTEKVNRATIAQAAASKAASGDGAIAATLLKEQREATAALAREEAKLATIRAEVNTLTRQSTSVSAQLITAREAEATADEVAARAKRDLAIATEQSDAAAARQTAGTKSLTAGFGMLSNAIGIAAVAFFALSAASEAATGQGIAENVASLILYGNIYEAQAKKMLEADIDRANGQRDVYEQEQAERRKRIAALEKDNEILSAQSGAVVGSGRLKEYLDTMAKYNFNPLAGSKVATQLEIETKALADNSAAWEEDAKKRALAAKIVESEDAEFTGPISAAAQARREQRAHDRRVEDAKNLGVPADTINSETLKLLEGEGVELVKIGRANSQKYLESFTKGDVGIINELLDQIKAEMREGIAGSSIQLSDQIKIEKVFPLIQQAIYQVRTYGEVSKDVYDQINVVLGTTDSNVTKLIRSYENLAKAIKDVDEAQRVVDANKLISRDLEFRSKYGDPNLRDRPQGASLPNGLNAMEYNSYTPATEAEKIAGEGLLALQQQLDDANKIATDHARQLALALRPLQAEIEETRRLADISAEENRVAVRNQQQIVDGIQRRQKATQEARAEAMRLATEELTAFQKGSKAREDQRQEEIRQLTKRNEDQGKQAEQHSAVYNAILNGTLDYYLRENEILDDQTRKIIEKWRAEYDGLNRQKNAEKDRATAGSRQQAEELLRFNEAIDKARQAGDRAAVARLTQQRDQYQRRSGQQLDLQNQRSTVAGNRADAAAETIGKEQAGVESADRAQANRNKAELDAKTEAARIARESDEKQAAAMQERIDQQAAANAAQDRADKKELDDANEVLRLATTKQEADAEYWRLRQRADQKAIDDVETAGKAQKIIDDDAILAAQKRLDIGNEYWKKQTDAAALADYYAGLTLEKANAYLTSQQGVLDKLKEQKGVISDINGLYDEIITKLREIFPNNPNLKPGAVPGALPQDPPQPGSGAAPAAQPNAAPPVAKPDPNAVDPRGAGTTPPGTKQAAGTNKKIIPGFTNAKPPADYHAEYDSKGQYWWVPDGFTVEDYGLQAGAGSLSTTPYPDPTRPTNTGTDGSAAPPETGSPGTRSLIGRSTPAQLARSAGIGSSPIVIPPSSSDFLTAASVGGVLAPNYARAAGDENGASRVELMFNGPLIGNAKIANDIDLGRVRTELYGGIKQAIKDVGRTKRKKESIF